jgi:hypothetical protein
MIRLLSDIGRAAVVLAAILTIVGCAMWGYTLAEGFELLRNGNVGFAGSGRITVSEVAGIVIGGAAGMIIAGAVFGAIATLYDIRDNIRMILLLKGGRSAADRVDDDRGSLVTGRRREPRIS